MAGKGPKKGSGREATQFKKGQPGGPGRPPGTKNKVGMEAKALARSIVESEEYQRNLVERLEKGKLHPTIEKLLWEYSQGKPSQPVEVAGHVTVGLADKLERAIERAARMAGAGDDEGQDD